jgi:MoaA/NifB/PqqE/SkfB family radical SAM enzyme
MLEKIIRVEPTVPMISLTWMIGARCNYDCMYCPSELHDSTSKHPDLDQLKQVWTNFYNKTQYSNLPYKLSFTGGEVTANKSFLPLIEYLKNGNFNIGQITITSNGSASQNYYLKLCKLVDTISLSTHSEYFDEKDFFTKVKAIDAAMIRPDKSLHVNVMDEFWNRDRILLYQQWLTQHNISYSINTINYNKQTRAYPIVQGTKNLEQF